MKKSFLIIVFIFSFTAAYSMQSTPDLNDQMTDDATQKTEEPSSLYDYELFKAVQHIYSIVDKLIIEAKEYKTSIDSGKKNWPGPNPRYHQTKKGLFLYDRKELWTPWGSIKLTGGGAGSCMGFSAFKQQFLKRFTTTFFQTAKIGYTSDRPQYYILKSDDINLKEHVVGGFPSEFDDIFTKISEKDLIDLKGRKNILIENDICGYEPIYKIHAIEGHQLPEPELLEYRNHSKYDEVQTAWEKLTERFRQETEIQK